MISVLIIFLLSAAFISLAVSANIATALFCIIAGGALFLLINAISHKKDKCFTKVYAMSFAVNSLYAALCFAYMHAHGYSYLLTFDTDNVIMPLLNDYLSSGKGYFDTLSIIWSQYDFFDRFQVGYYSYLYTWGYFVKGVSSSIDAYFVIQLAHYAFSAFIAPLLYKVLVLSDVPQKKAIRYSLIIALCSILFFYSSTIIRDGMIATIMLYIYYVMMHEFKMSNILKIIVSIYLISTLRIESGLFCVVFIPFYYYLWMAKKGSRSAYFMAFLIVGMLVLGFFISNYSRVAAVYNFNYEAYIEGVDEGSGVIGFLQRIPVLGNILSIFYIAFLPLPCWSKMFVSATLTLPECYNVMCFPLAIAAFFNTYIICYLGRFLLSGMKMQKGEMRFLFILMIPAFLLLYLQSAVVAQRRVMAAYAVFYLVWAVIHNSQSKKFNSETLFFAIIFFSVIQILTGLR